ncbi:glycosyl hydrolase family 28-related protein [Streptomyces sp. NPDC005507]|uniref:glycosyl hydrolase family 28-related protein n=1 Tax=unclassified Streptomyces TaxID=2593676 RepID=UPI0033B5C6F2
MVSGTARSALPTSRLCTLATLLIALCAVLLPPRAAHAADCTRSGSYWAPAGFVSVKAYGAAGDGITDDSVALNCAFAGGGDVWLPTGTYAVAGDLSLPDALTIAGESDSATPTVIKATAPALVMGETSADTNTTRTGTITVQDLFLDGIELGVNGTKTSAVVDRVVFSDSQGYLSVLDSPASYNLVLVHLTGTSTVRDSLFLHGAQSTDAVPISLYRTSGLTIRENIVGLSLAQTSWLGQWPGAQSWTSQSADGTANPQPAAVTLQSKLAALQNLLDLGDSQGQWRSGLYTGFDTGLVVDSNVLNADPATPSTRDHAAYLKGVSGQYTRNWVRGWPDSAYGGVKARNTEGPLVIGANYLYDTPVLLYAYSDATYPEALTDTTVCGNALTVVSTSDPTHAGIVYYENTQPTALSGNVFYDNVFSDPGHTTGITVGQLSPAVLTQTELDAFTSHTSNTYSDNGQSVPITVPSGLTAHTDSGAPATDSCSGLTVPSYTIPAYGS